MRPVTIVGTLHLRAAHADEARATIASVVEQTHREPGCLLYAAYADTDDPLTMVVIEKWASRQALDEHNSAPYLAEAMGHVGRLLTAAPRTRVLEPLGYGTADKAALR